MAAALLLALLAPAVALAQGGDIQERKFDDLLAVVKDIVQKLLLVAGFVLVGAAIWQGVRIATVGVDRPHERGSAIAGLLYVIFGAVVCFGAYFWIGLAKGLISGR